jgi:predicted RND superfamily exporter protein
MLGAEREPGSTSLERLTRFALDRPRTTLAALAVVSAFLGWGAIGLETDVGYRSLLGPQHPAVARFDALLDRFGGGFPLAAVYDCRETERCESAFDPDPLRMSAQISEALAGEASIRRVESLGTTALLVPDGDYGVEARQFVASGELAPDRAALMQRALQDSPWPRQLVGAEGRVGALVIDVASSDSDDQVAAYTALDAALAPHEARGYRFHRVGGPVEFVVAGGELQADTARLVPLMVVLVGCVLFALFRSLAIAVAALATVGISVLWTFGAMAWVGWAQNSVTQALPPLLLVIGVCDVIHLLARLATDANEQPQRERRELLLDAVREVGGACVITSFTTAAGFASFATSGLESFVRFGLAAALGVGAALVLTFSLLPLLAQHLPLAHAPAAAAATRWHDLLRRTVGGAQRHSRVVLGVTALVGIALGWGATSLRVDASFEDLYGEDSRVVRWANHVSDHLRRPDTLEVVLSPPDPDRFADPAALEVVERSAHALDDIEGLGPARSVVDWISWVHQLANDDEPFWYRLPGRESVTLEIVEAIDEQDPVVLTRWLDREDGGYRVSLESEKLPQEDLRRALRQSRAELAKILPEGWHYELTGPLAVVHEMVDEIQRTQLLSFATATVIVLVLVALFLSSLRLALLALVPTVLPALAILGAMGWSGAPLDVGSAMVAAVVIGIAVDDSIHLLSVYQRLRRAGQERAEAMANAVLRVGRAVVTTSLALALGFFALTLSSWNTIAHFGALTGVAVLGALVAVVAVLPAWTALPASAVEADSGSAT